MTYAEGQLVLDRARKKVPAWMWVLGLIISIVIGVLLPWRPFLVGSIIVGLIFWLLPFISIELGLYGMVILLPLPGARVAIGDAFTISFSSLIMISILLSLITRRVITRDRLLGFNPMKFWPVWIFVLAHFASIAVSVNLTRSVGIFIHLLIWVLLMLVTYQTITSRKILRNILLIMVAEALIITFVGYYNNYVNKIDVASMYHYTGGVASIYTNRNQYGHYLVTILPLAVAFTLYEPSGRFRLLNLGAAASIAISLITTFSRGAWVACIAGMLVFLRNRRMWVLALMTLMAIYWWTPENIKMRFRSIWDPQIRSANQSRMLIHASGLLLFLQNPVLGVGTGNFEVAVKETRISTLLPTNLSAHDTYLEMAAETGIVGMIALIALYIFITRAMTGIRIPPARGPDRALKLGLLSAWISLLVHYVVVTAFFNSMPWFLMGVILAAHNVLMRNPETPDSTTADPA